MGVVFEFFYRVMTDVFVHFYGDVRIKDEYIIGISLINIVGVVVAFDVIPSVVCPCEDMSQGFI